MFVGPYGLMAGLLLPTRSPAPATLKPNTALGPSQARRLLQLVFLRRQAIPAPAPPSPVAPPLALPRLRPLPPPSPLSAYIPAPCRVLRLSSNLHAAQPLADVGGDS